MIGKATPAFVFSLLTLLLGYFLVPGAPITTAQSQPTAPLAYWKLDETSPGTYADSADGNTGICIGACPLPDASGIDGSQLFDGATTKITVPTVAGNPFDWAANDSFSIEFWARGIPGQTCALDDNEVVIGRTDRDSSLRWWLGCHKNKGAVPYFYLRSSSGEEHILFAPSQVSFNDGQWHHVVGVRDDALNVTRLYVDGFEVMSLGGNFNSGFTAVRADQQINIGWFDLTKKYHFSGFADEISVYKRALSLAEIRKNYAYGLAGLPHDALASVTLQQSVQPPVIYQGENATFTYTVANPADVMLSDVQLNSSVCASPNLVSGDVNTNALLDSGETWIYTCTTTFQTDTVATATVTTKDPANQTVSAQVQAAINVISLDIPLSRTVNPTVAYANETVTFSYAVSTKANQNLSDVSVTDNACPTVIYVGGDTNGDQMINGQTSGSAAETWTFTCSVALSADTTSTAVASATLIDHTVVDETILIVDVINPAISIGVSPSRQSIYVGEEVTYTYTVENDGDDPLSSVTVQDSHCSPTTGPTGDANSNAKLDILEVWTFQCTTSLNTSVNSTAIVTSLDSRGGIVQDSGTASVEVVDYAIFLPLTAR